MPILALYSGILGLLLVYLSLNVSINRKKYTIGIGDGENKDLARAIRVQANFTEYVPVALILLAVFESNHGHALIAHIAGGLLVLARILHAYGLGKTVKVSFNRAAGAILTWLTIIGLAGANIYYFVITQLL